MLYFKQTYLFIFKRIHTEYVGGDKKIIKSNIVCIFFVAKRR